MTSESITRVLKKYKRKTPKDSLDALRPSFSAIPEEAAEKFSKLPTKSVILTFLFSFLLGGIGVDRFYLRDIGSGVAKLVCRVIAVAFRVWVTFQFADIRGMVVFSDILFIISYVWCIADIYYTYKLAKERNLVIITEFVHQQMQA